MSKIFFSWASPDHLIADQIRDRLRDAGLPVREYTHDMLAGDDIPQWVADAIEEARIVIACVSQAALAHSEWVKTEVTMAGARLRRSANRLERLIVVRIGEVPDGWQSLMLPNVRHVKVTDPHDEATLEELIDDVTKSLGLDAPFVIPAALYAMTAAEFAELRQSHDPAQFHRVDALCRGVGMPELPDLWDELGKRHGATSEDFAPYADGRSLIQVTQAVVQSVNARRKETARRPVYLRWYSRDELKVGKVRDRWRNSHTVMFVDSVSALYPAVMVGLQPPPPEGDPRRAAVIYLPPYTRHTGELERLIEHSLEGQMYLSDMFRWWRDEKDRRSLAFDIPTETSLRRWLDQLLVQLDVQKEPWPDNVSRISPDPPRRIPWTEGMPGARQ
jgi:hypothetical protein